MYVKSLLFFFNIVHLTCSSASLAVLTIARRVWVVDISIRGGKIAAPVTPTKGLSTEKSVFLLLDSFSLFCGAAREGRRPGKEDGLKRGSRGGGNPFLAALK